MTGQQERPDSTQERLPQALIDDLADLCDARVLVPPDLDEKILALAADRLAPVRRRRSWAGTWAAAAAVALVAGVATLLLVQQPGPVSGRDINADGAVDILDAFAVARGIEDRTAPDHWDVNGDAIVDRRDVDALAMAAVALPKGRS